MVKRLRTLSLGASLLLLLSVALTACGGRATDRTPVAAPVAAPVKAPATAPAPAPTTAQTTSPSQPVAKTPATQVAPVAPAAKPTPVTTGNQAIDIVSALPEMAQFRESAKKSGSSVVYDFQQTPSRFVVIVGSGGSDRVMWTEWYLVSKADGTVTKWDMSKGSPPRD